MTDAAVKHSVVMLVILIFPPMTCHALCRKIEQTREVHMDGYKSHIVYPNACEEVATSKIMPNILISTDSQIQHFRKVYVTDCCCEVRLSSLEMVTLERFDGSDFRDIYYRQIHECGCGPCPSLTTESF